MGRGVNPSLITHEAAGVRYLGVYRLQDQLCVASYGYNNHPATESDVFVFLHELIHAFGMGSHDNADPFHAEHLISPCQCRGTSGWVSRTLLVHVPSEPFSP